jgi:hypothetical protein
MYPPGGVGYLRLVRLSRLAARAPPEFARGSGRVVLSVLAAPEGDLVFWGKPSYPLNLLIQKSLHLYSQLGFWVCKLQKELGNPF